MSGKTIVITRALGDDAELREALQERGHYVIHAPATEILFDHTQRTLLARLIATRPDAFILTSAHGAQALAASTELRDDMLLCVGNRTAYVAENLGFTRVHCVGEDVDALLAEISGGYDEDARFVYASALDIRHDIEGTLATFGMECQRIVLYQAAALTELPETLIAQLARGRVDGFTFLSARSAEIICALLESASVLESVASCDAYVMSETIAAALSGPWRAVQVSQEPTLASLLTSVDNQRI